MIIRFVLFVFVVVIICWIPFNLSSETREVLKTSSSLLAAASSLLTLVVAFLLFDRYGLKKSLRQKQYETVLSLIEEVKKVSITIDGQTPLLLIYRPTVDYKTYERYFNKKLLFSLGFLGGLNSVFDFANHVYLPKQIAVKLDGFRPGMLASMKPEVTNDPIYIKAYFEKDDPKFKIVMGQLNERDYTLYDYHCEWIELIDEIEKWLRENDIDTTDLNIFKSR